MTRQPPPAIAENLALVDRQSSLASRQRTTLAKRSMKPRRRYLKLNRVREREIRTRERRAPVANECGAGAKNGSTSLRQRRSAAETDRRKFNRRAAKTAVRCASVLAEKNRLHPDALIAFNFRKFFY